MFRNAILLILCISVQKKGLSSSMILQFWILIMKLDPGAEPWIRSSFGLVIQKWVNLFPVLQRIMNCILSFHSIEPYLPLVQGTFHWCEMLMCWQNKTGKNCSNQPNKWINDINLMTEAFMIVCQGKVNLAGLLTVLLQLWGNFADGYFLELDFSASPVFCFLKYFLHCELRIPSWDLCI